MSEDSTDFSLAEAYGATLLHGHIYCRAHSLARYLHKAELNDRIILELKAVSSLNQAHERQLVSYMKSTGIQEGMLLNFGNVRRLEWRVNSP